MSKLLSAEVNIQVVPDVVTFATVMMLVLGKFTPEFSSRIFLSDQEVIVPLKIPTSIFLVKTRFSIWGKL